MSTSRSTSRRRSRGPKHPGVVLIKPDPDRRIGWRVRYTDPDTSKVVKETLDPFLTTAEARADWCVRKSQALARRRLELEQGATRATGTALEAAVGRYYDAHPRLRDKTRAGYSAATSKFLAWCKSHRIETTDDVTRAKLLAWREAIVAEPMHAPTKGGKRGARTAKEGTPRSAFSINRELAAVRTVLGYLGELDLLSRIKEGDLKRGLRKLPTDLERVEYLTAAELRTLFEAAARHDEAKFALTREEHDGRRPKGSTARFEPITPFLLGVLLSGMRATEAITLNVTQVVLDGAGEIRLTARTKTKRARTVDLSVSPGLRSLLAALVGERTEGSVFGVSRDGATAAMRRLREDFGAPKAFTYQALRATCGTFLTNAPGIFGAASAYRSARQLGHSVAVAEKHYLGLERNIPKDATTLEAAMRIEDIVQKVVNTWSTTSHG